jgi:hypothetical protein
MTPGVLGSLLAAVLLGVTCSEAPPPSSQAGAPAAEPAETPPGGAGRADSTGFLDREDVTLRMAGAGLIVDVVAMNAEVVELATDDLRVYLEEALKKVPDTVPADLQREGTFFLVGFSSTEKEISFEPAQVRVESEGRQFYPRYIVPVSAGFEDKVLELFKPVWAVYIFDPGIDLISTLEFVYRDDLSTRQGWRRVVQNVEEARSRAKR